MKNTSPLINISELQNIFPNNNLVLIDARSGQKSNYLKSHLKGALFVDLNEDLSDIKADFAEGGRHPLPSPQQFANLLTSLGITPNSHVVVYDDKNGANAAARFWWMLTSIGHQQVQVLNGGLIEAEKVKFPTSAGEEKVADTKPYFVHGWQLPLSSLEEVEQVSQNETFLVVDVRAPKRYAGVFEPIDLIAGHIPGAINVPFASNLAESGLFLSEAELQDKYEKIIGDRPIEKVIFHCGSGVTACHSLLAMAQAKMPIPKLYVGSWSEWSRNGKDMIVKE